MYQVPTFLGCAINIEAVSCPYANAYGQETASILHCCDIMACTASQISNKSSQSFARIYQPNLNINGDLPLCISVDRQCDLPLSLIKQ